METLEKKVEIENLTRSVSDLILMHPIIKHIYARLIAFDEFAPAAGYRKKYYVGCVFLFYTDTLTLTLKDRESCKIVTCTSDKDI